MIRSLLTLGLLACMAVTGFAADIDNSGSVSVLVSSCDLPICSDRCFDYKTLRPRLEPCGPHFETSYLVKDNCACCYVPVKMCLPCCCTGDPEVCYKGKHVVEYSWCSGYKVRVILTKHGKVFVHNNA